MIPIGLYVAHVYRTAGAHLKNLKFKAGALQRCVARRPVQISLCKRSTLTSNSLDGKLKDCSFVSLAFKLGEVCCCPALQALNPLLDLRILCIQKGRNGRNLYISISSIHFRHFQVCCNMLPLLLRGSLLDLPSRGPFCELDIDVLFIVDHHKAVA